MGKKKEKLHQEEVRTFFGGFFFFASFPAYPAIFTMTSFLLSPLLALLHLKKLIKNRDWERVCFMLIHHQTGKPRFQTESTDIY